MRARSRPQAIERMAAALDACVVDGVRTTLPFLRRVIASEAFRRGETDTQMVDQGAFAS